MFSPRAVADLEAASSTLEIHLLEKVVDGRTRRVVLAASVATSKAASRGRFKSGQSSECSRRVMV